MKLTSHFPPSCDGERIASKTGFFHKTPSETLYFFCENGYRKLPTNGSPPKKRPFGDEGGIMLDPTLFQGYRANSLPEGIMGSVLYIVFLLYGAYPLYYS